MNPSRREFIKKVSSASLVLFGGRVIKLSASDLRSMQKKVTFRFAVASDGHYGEPKTEYGLFHEDLVKNITNFHKSNALNFCVINGDIIHDEGSLLTEAKSHYDKLPVKYYVTKGNHDKVSDAYWQEVWSMPVNHEVHMEKDVILLATTSNESGDFLSPDLEWLEARLASNTKARNIFLFLHIPQANWNGGSLETPAFFELLKSFKNVRGIFHGHEHKQDNVKMFDKIPYMWDSHIGGSWGTSYRGFRVVELTKDNQMLTYIMNPLERINQAAL
ncbi:MAG: metallophosphoesterase [Chryseolinea sp.]